MIGNIYGPLGPVHRLHSLYNYCFYVNTGEDSQILWQWRPTLYEDVNGLGVKDENGDYIEDTSRIEVSALKIDDKAGLTTQKLYQTKGEMIDSRVLYQAMGKFDTQGTYS